MSVELTHTEDILECQRTAALHPLPGGQGARCARCDAGWLAAERGEPRPSAVTEEVARLTAKLAAVRDIIVNHDKFAAQFVVAAPEWERVLCLIREATKEREP